MSASPALLAAFQAIAHLHAQADLDAGRRKEQGITYTPPAVAMAMVDWLAPQPTERVHEPSCGRGVFLVALVGYWLAQGRTAQWVDEWAHDHLRAGDLDPVAVADAARVWDDLLRSLGVDHPRPLQVRCEDGLFGPWAQEPVDIVVGNPPYVRFQNLPDEVRARLQAKYASCARGNVDLYYAFFEDALRRAQRTCYIMPHSWLTNASARALRQMVAPRLEGLIDFGSRLMFAPVRTYTAIVLCGPAQGPTIAVRQSLPGEPGDWQHLERTDPRWSPARFSPLVATASSGGPTLGEAAEVLSGIATLADGCFTLPSPRRVEGEGGVWIEQDDPQFPGHTLRVPEAYAPRLVKLTKPVWGLDGPRILCPYGKDGRIVAEADLQALAPDLLAWLNRRRAVLDGRDKGKTQDYDAWYAYGRRQGLWTLTDATQALWAVPMMGRGQLAPQRVTPATLGGRFLFTSGFLVRPKDKVSLDRLGAAMQAPAAWALVQAEGKVWAGTGDYRTFGARTLRRVPLPDGH